MPLLTFNRVAAADKITRARIIMSAFAELGLHLGGIIVWLVVGLGAGCLAGPVMKGSGYGISVDIILGLIGAAFGGFVFGLLDTGAIGVLGSMMLAFLGACILISVVRIAARAQHGTQL
jgi:uncharacterized membrane protein YeaQ/YmgE (transglycosylase-associated protein family)